MWRAPQELPAHQCGWLLADGRRCEQLTRHHDCGRHLRRPVTDQDKNGVVYITGRGCQMEATPEGRSWRCSTHETDEWRMAVVLGAALPCRIPLSWRERTHLAMSPYLDDSTARLLMLDMDDIIAQHLAENGGTPADLLVELSGRGDTFLKYVLENPGCPQELLARYGEHPDEYMRRAVASNAHTPVSMLRRLSRCGDLVVETIATQTLAYLQLHPTGVRGTVKV